MMAIMVMRTCDQIEGGLPKDVRIWMILNIIMDFGIGIVPFFGDVCIPLVDSFLGIADFLYLDA